MMLMVLCDDCRNILFHGRTLFLKFECSSASRVASDTRKKSAPFHVSATEAFAVCKKRQDLL